VNGDTNKQFSYSSAMGTWNLTRVDPEKIEGVYKRTLAATPST
jgi:hypothetical protein